MKRCQKCYQNLRGINASESPPRYQLGKLVDTPGHLPLAHVLRQPARIKGTAMTQRRCATVEAALTYHASGRPFFMHYGVCEHDKRGGALVYLTRKSLPRHRAQFVCPDEPCPRCV